MSGMGCAENIIIQLRVISKKLPLKTAESPRKSADSFIMLMQSVYELFKLRVQRKTFLILIDLVLPTILKSTLQ